MKPPKVTSINRVRKWFLDDHKPAVFKDVEYDVGSETIIIGLLMVTQSLAIILCTALALSKNNITINPLSYYILT